MKRSAAFGLLAFLGGGACFADGVPPSWSGEAGMSYARVGGNADSETIGASARLARTHDAWMVEASGDYLRSGVERRAFSERVRGAFAAEYSLRRRASLYGRESYLRDQFAGIHRQFITDAGGLLKPVSNDTTVLSVRIAVAGLRERLAVSGPDNSFFGARFGLGLSRKLGTGAELANELDHVRNFGDADDWRLGNEAALSASISHIIALKVSHQFSYRREPAPGKKRDDTTFLVSLIARWPGGK